MFNWVQRLFTGRTDLRHPAPHITHVANYNGYHFPNLAETTAQASTYTTSPWVYVAVSRIAEAASLVPLHVYRLDGEQRIAVEQHPLERLLNCPNPFTSRFDLMEQTVGMLELTGNAYWFLSGNAGTPQEIWMLRPDRVSIVPDERSYVRGYIYEIDGVRVPLEAVEVVHFKRWHPLNDYYGLSALQAAANSVHTDKAMAQWNRNTFGQDNAVPSGIVTLPETTAEPDYERIKREWVSSYGATQRKTAFLRSGNVTWQSISRSHNDLDFLRGRQANRDEILNIFGVPVGLVSDNATEANAKVAERTFVERTLYPKLVRIASVITAQLLPFWKHHAVAEFADIRPTDKQARIDEIRAATQIMSVNEVRARYFDLPPVTWGEVPPELVEEVIVSDDEKGSGDSPSRPNETKALIADELRAWEKFTLRRLGREDARSFTVHHVPDDVAFELSARLVEVDEESAVKAAFAAAREASNEW